MTYASYATCVWAFSFAALSFYWAAGGTALGDTIGPYLSGLGLARDPVFVAILWGTGVLKALVGLIALAMVYHWGRYIPRWMLLTAAWSAVAVMAVYEGLASLIQHALMAAGVISTPAALGSTAAHWHLFLWDPWWLLGGVLLMITTWLYQRAGVGKKR